MKKEFINRYLKKFGIELHGSGYIKKLLSGQQSKNSFESQAAILNYDAKMIFDIGANKGLATNEYLQYFPDAEIHAFDPFPGYETIWEEIKTLNKKVIYNEIGL